MKPNLTVPTLLLVLSVLLPLAQADQPALADDWKASTLNQPGQEYPRVNSQAVPCRLRGKDQQL